jgi:hypothetical protein
VPAEIMQLFMPAKGSRPAGCDLIYRPMLIGLARINFVDTKTRVDVTRTLTAVTPVSEDVIPVDWSAGRAVGVSADDLEQSPQAEAQFASLPAAALKAKSYAAWSKELVAWLYREQTLDLFASPQFKLVSRPEETERDFRIRLQQAAHEARDEAADKLRQKYAPKTAALQERLRVAQQAVDREKAQAKQQQMQTAISFGATLLGAFVGRKAVSASSVGRATTAARGVSRSMKEQRDIDRAGDTVESLKARLAELETSFKADLDAVETKWDAQTEALEQLTIKPKKTNIAVQLLALTWTPHWRDAQGSLQPAWE